MLERTGSQIRPATKEELDDIADRMTVAENHLLSGNSAGEERKVPSLLERVRSNHRTPLVGNYSYEVSRITDVTKHLLQGIVFWICEAE